MDAAHSNLIVLQKELLGKSEVGKKEPSVGLAANRRWRALHETYRVSGLVHGLLCEALHSNPLLLVALRRSGRSRTLLRGQELPFVAGY